MEREDVDGEERRRQRMSQWANEWANKMVDELKGREKGTRAIYSARLTVSFRVSQQAPRVQLRMPIFALSAKCGYPVLTSRSDRRHWTWSGEKDIGLIELGVVAFRLERGARDESTGSLCDSIGRSGLSSTYSSRGYLWYSFMSLHVLIEGTSVRCRCKRNVGA